VDGGRCDLVSRNGNTFNSFGPLCQRIAESIPGAGVIDGEIVFLDRAGRPQFYSLMRCRSPHQFVAFDILWLDGRDLRGLPLIERKRILRCLVPDSGTVLYSSPVEGRGVDLFAEVCANDLEGIVAKRRDGLYTPDATT
jgi:bifunctional non-homologous end joining protein LigD